MNFDQKISHETNPETSLNQISKIVKKPTNNRVKPKFFKLMGQIMNLHIDVF
jgi:hypothetical protein